MSRLGRSGRHERLAALGEHLPPADRALAKAAWRDGRPIREVAAMLEVSPATLARRLARLARRLETPEYAFTVLRANDLEPRLRAIAELRVLEGLSQRACALRLGLSDHAVRRACLSITAMAEAGLARPHAHNQGRPSARDRADKPERGEAEQEGHAPAPLSLARWRRPLSRSA